MSSKWKVKRDDEPTFVPKKTKDKNKNKNKSPKEKEKELKERERELARKEKELAKREQELENKTTEPQEELTKEHGVTADSYLKKNEKQNKEEKEKRKVNRNKNIKSNIKLFGKALVSPRKGILKRNKFYWYLLTLAVLVCAAIFLTLDSGFQPLIILVSIIFLNNIICQRFRQIGLRWFYPIIAIILAIISVLVSAGLSAATIAITSADSDTYSSIISIAQTLDNSVGTNIISATIFLGVAAVVYILFVVFTLVLCFLKDGACRTGKVMGRVYLGLALFSAILLPISSLCIMNATNDTLNSSAKILNKAIFTQQEDGTYLIKGKFKSGVDNADFNELVEYYEAASVTQEYIDMYKNDIEYMTDYTDTLCISELMGQNATKGGTVVGVLELGVVAKDNDSHENSITIENITVNGIQKVIKQEYKIANTLNFLMIEVPALTNGAEITITTKINGETKVLNVLLIDSEAEAAQSTDDAAGTNDNNNATENKEE